MDKDKLAKLKEIQKLTGVTIQLASDVSNKEYLPTQVPEIDKFLGGGFVRGNYTVIYGSASCGKSTLALNTIASYQKQEKICVYLDLEHSFDRIRAESLGVNLNELVYMGNIGTAEQAMDVVIALAKKKVGDFVVIDSIQAMSPKGEQETAKGKAKSMDSEEMAMLARKLGKFFRASTTPVYEANMAVLLIGQVRTTGLGTFIVRDGLSGGNALHHWAWQIVHMRRGQRADSPKEKIKNTFTDPDGKEHKETIEVDLGFDCVLKMEKTKASNSSKENDDIHIPFYYKTGFILPLPNPSIVAPENEMVPDIADGMIDISPKIPSDLLDNSKLQKLVNNQSAILSEPKKKRGRPKKVDTSK